MGYTIIMLMENMADNYSVNWADSTEHLKLVLDLSSPEIRL